jgi:signal transduction histidine kinase
LHRIAKQTGEANFSSRDVGRSTAAEVWRRKMQANAITHSPGQFSLTFLAEASQILSRSLDPVATVTEVARLYVPLIADTCAVDLLEAGQWRRAAAAHVDERRQQKLWQAGEALWAKAMPAALPALLAEGETAHHIVLDGLRNVPTTEPDQRTHLLRALAGVPDSNASSCLAVPLMARGRTFGIMTLSCCDVRRRFSAEEIALAAELARRAATALDNARLYRNAERSRADAEAARARSQFLAHTSEILGHAVQYSQVVEDAARLAVQGLADCCLVDLHGQAYQHIWAIDHHDPVQATVLRTGIESDRCMLTVASEKTATDAMQSPRDTAAGTTAAKSLWRRFAGLPQLKLPLIVRGEMHGTVTLWRKADTGDAFDAETRALSEDFLVRVAGALDRAWLFAQMQSAVSIRDQFLSIASHELRTPLTALELQLGNLQRLMGKDDPKAWRPRCVEKLERATRQTTRLAKLIDNLLDVSRISAGSVRLACEAFDLTALCREVIERCGEEAALANSSLQYNGESHCVGTWDPLRLEQVITNLLGNALKYGAGKPIVVNLMRQPRGVHLTVVDGGIGVAPVAAKRIFERFERAVSPREFGGLGLGLFISREIVEAHGGRIGVQSSAGCGATFFVELPWQAANQERPQALDINRDLLP